MKESFENGNVVYRGTGSDKDMSYFGIIYINLKKCVSTWLFYIPYGNLIEVEDFLKGCVENGVQGFSYKSSTKEIFN